MNRPLLVALLVGLLAVGAYFVGTFTDRTDRERAGHRPTAPSLMEESSPAKAPAKETSGEANDARPVIPSAPTASELRADSAPTNTAPEMPSPALPPESASESSAPRTSTPIPRSPTSSDATAEPAPTSAATPVVELPVGKTAPQSGTDAPSATSFDVVRVGPDGSAVVAGRAPEGSRVILRNDGIPVGETQAGPGGDFAIIADQPLPPGTRRLDLEVHPSAGPTIVSEDQVVVVIPDGADVAQGREPPAMEKATLAVQLPPKGPARLLSPPPGSDPSMTLSFETVDYDSEGRVRLGGRAPAGAHIAAYLDGRLLGDGITDDDGQWRIAPATALEPGVYTLRADQVNQDGSVAARVEIPFRHEDLDMSLDHADVVVIQPGHTLWHIARRTYGDGLSYTVIHAANRDQIRDPDLIYPGQVFSLPERE